MRKELRAPFMLSAALAGVMAVQSGLGLAFPEQYRDAAWLRAAWFGNDGVTLVSSWSLRSTSRSWYRCSLAAGSSCGTATRGGMLSLQSLGSRARFTCSC